MLKSYLENVRTIIITDKDLSKMENREDIYVDKMLGLIVYNCNFVDHKHCYKDFSEAYDCDCFNEISIAKDGNICFRIDKASDGNYFVINYLPKEMSWLKLESYLEVIDKMNDKELSLFAAMKLLETGSVDFQYTEDFNENIHRDIIDSYLEKTK